MLKLSKQRQLYGVVLFAIVLFMIIYSLLSKDQYCPVIDDLRVVDTITVVNTFNQTKIAYFVDLQNSYTILVKKSQVDAAYTILANLGIKEKSIKPSGCKVVH